MRDPGTKRFHLGDVLSVTTGRMLSPRRMSGVYALLRHLRRGAPVHPSQVTALRAACQPHLLRHFPQLATIDASGASRQDPRPWLTKTCDEHGHWLDVPALPVENLPDIKLPSRSGKRAEQARVALAATLASQPAPPTLENSLCERWAQLCETVKELPAWASRTALRHAWSVPWVQPGHTSPTTNSSSKNYQDVRRRWANSLRPQLTSCAAQPLACCGILVVRHAPVPLRWGPALAGLAPLLDVLIPRTPTLHLGLGVVSEDSTLGMPGGVMLAQHVCTEDRTSTHVYVFERSPV